MTLAVVVDYGPATPGRSSPGDGRQRNMFSWCGVKELLVCCGVSAPLAAKPYGRNALWRMPPMHGNGARASRSRATAGVAKPSGGSTLQFMLACGENNDKWSGQARTEVLDNVHVTALLRAIRIAGAAMACRGPHKFRTFLAFSQRN